MNVPTPDPVTPPSNGQSRALGQLARELDGLWQLLPGLRGAPPPPTATSRR